MTFLKNTRDRINADYAELVKEFPELLKEPEKLMETLSPEESLGTSLSLYRNAGKRYGQL